MVKVLTPKIEALTAYANTITGKSDTTLSDAVVSLANGYGQGGGYSLDDIASGAEPSGVFDITGVNFVRDYAFYKYPNITEVKGKTSILTANCFMGCTGIEKIHVELTGNTGGANYFNGCTKLKTAVFLQNITYGEYSGAYSMFNGCTSLEVADLMAQRLGNNTFFNNQKLNTLILRNTSQRTAFNGDPKFSMTQFKESGTGGTLYVPQSMISAYEADSDWSTLLSYSNNKILPIEGSIYETQYADGTPISA
jgi:hypothetical protein